MRWLIFRILAYMVLVPVLLGYVATFFLQPPTLELVCLEPSHELAETVPVSSDLSWTKFTPTDPANPVKCVTLRNGALYGELCSNEIEVENPSSTANMSGFHSLRNSRFPGHNIFNLSGLNFEHILSGRAKDWDPGHPAGNFAPRMESSALNVHSESSASLFWAAANSRWGASSEMTFSLDEESHVDLEFRTALQTAPGADYLLYMWANYMQGVRAPTIQFWGMRDFTELNSGLGSGTIGWVYLNGVRGAKSSDSGEGIVHFLGTPALPTEPGVVNLNYIDHNSVPFLLPLFFGIVDGDGDLYTRQDNMVYIMMFDQAEPVRFVMWDFSKGAGHPVWDWQYVLRKPQTGQTYGYRARVVYKPYAGPEDVVAEYVQWTKSLSTPRHHLKIDVDPPESATVFPPETAGTYGDRVQVYFGVNPAPGWHFDHWEGNATYKKRRFTRVDMNGDEAVHAVCHREG